MAFRGMQYLGAVYRGLRSIATLNFLLLLTVTTAPRQITANPLRESDTEAAVTAGPSTGETLTENTTAAAHLRDFEVEAKWEIPNNSSYVALVERFANGSEVFNYTAIVRWGNTCRKYVDYYYDTDDLVMTDKLNSLRHRTRYRASPPSHSNRWTDVLFSNWVSDWDLIQYKGKPSRVGAIWGRNEVGSRESEPDEPTPIAVITACDMSYDAIRAMKKEHGRLNCADLRPTLKVEDYRLRIGLEDNNSRVFEVSLDRFIITDYLFNYWPIEVGAMEIEIELVGDVTEESVRLLGDLAAALEKEFPQLYRSTYSKGGLFLPELEVNGMMTRLMCGEDGWPCSDYTCVSREQRCDGVDNCSDGGDEKHCPSTHTESR